MTEREKVHYKLMKELITGIDSQTLEAAFDERFNNWWKEFESWIRRELKKADFVSKSNVDLEKWVVGTRNGFLSNLYGSLVAKMKSWALYWSSLPFRLGIYNVKGFDIESHIDAATVNMAGENLKVALDEVFYVPIHALSLVGQHKKFLLGKPVEPENRELYKIIDDKLNENRIRKPKPLLKSAVIGNICKSHGIRGKDALNLRKRYDKWVNKGRK